MMDLVVEPDFWVSRMLPEGTIERWLVADGADVKLNDPVVELRIEKSLVELKSPVSGRLTISVPGNSIVEPGTVIGRVSGGV